jgi:hypothetical protein
MTKLASLLALILQSNRMYSMLLRMVVVTH